MVPICDDVYVEPATTPEERERLRLDYPAAGQRVADVFGGWRGEHPVAIFCKTDACKVYFSGPPRRSWTLSPGGRVPGAVYVAGPRTTVIIDDTGPPARGILAHEMVHVEAGFRVGHAFVPQWFHEGLAASVANAPACAAGVARGIADLRRLDANSDWARYTNQRDVIHATYCQARAEGVRLFVNGVGSAEARAERYNAPGAGAAMVVTWGSSNTRGDAECWRGGIAPGGFRGAVSGMAVYNVELDPARIAALAAVPPA